jgi:hypothetical protein
VYSDGTSTIGAHTDIGEWWEWFRGPSSAAHLKALYREHGQQGDYARLEDPDPVRENEMVLLQSSFANSRLFGLPTDPATSDANSLRGQPSSSSEMTVSNAKGIYNDILDYFAAHQEKLFIVVTAPPLASEETSAEEAANARGLNEWLVNDWLRGYAHKNVAVLDFYSTLTSNGGDANVNDLGAETGSHHRWWSGAVQHVDAEGDVSAYAESVTGSHPTAAGMQKATVELVTLLNYYRNRWKGLLPTDAQVGARAVRGEGVSGARHLEAIAPPGRTARRP